MRSLSYGFTLIELLVTITVAGILMGIAVPAFDGFLKNDRDLGQINSLVSSFNYARSEAVKRASPNGITVCASGDGITCDLATTSWVEGWIVIYVDPVDPTKNFVFQAVPALGGTNTVTASTTGPTPGGVTFASSGLASEPLTVRVCDVRGAAFARQLEVLSTGRAVTTQTAGKAADNVTPLTCP
jgi:type IV fimbrial biogenesis protein FimT